jgi:hypothetical protein
VALRQPNDKLVRNLAEDSDVLERQRISFTSISKEMRLVCLHEELPTGIGIVGFSLPLSAHLTDDLIRLFPSALPVLTDF